MIKFYNDDQSLTYWVEKQNKTLFSVKTTKNGVKYESQNKQVPRSLFWKDLSTLCAWGEHCIVPRSMLEMCQVPFSLKVDRKPRPLPNKGINPSFIYQESPISTPA